MKQKETKTNYYKILKMNQFYVLLSLFYFPTYNGYKIRLSLVAIWLLLYSINVSVLFIIINNY